MSSVTESFKQMKFSVKKHLLKTFRRTMTMKVAPQVGEQPSLSSVEDSASTAISTSATGEGIHTRWVYPKESDTVSFSSSLSAPATISTASSFTLLGSDEETKDNNVVAEADAPQKPPTIRLPITKQPASSRAPTSIIVDAPTRPTHEVFDNNGTSPFITASSGGEIEQKKRLIIKIPSARASAVAQSKKLPGTPGRLIYKGTDPDGSSVTIATSATGQGVHTRWNSSIAEQPKEKLTIALPASRKRTCPTDGDNNDANANAVQFVRRVRARHSVHPSAPCAVVSPTGSAGNLIYSGPSVSGQPVVITTSATGQGAHIRWLDSTTAEASSDGEDADDEASSDSDSESKVTAIYKQKGFIVTIPPLRTLKRSRSSDVYEEEDDGPARRTRSRVSASLSSGSSASSTSTSSTLSPKPSLGNCRKTFYTRDAYAPSPPPPGRHFSRSLKKSRR